MKSLKKNKMVIGVLALLIIIASIFVIRPLYQLESQSQKSEQEDKEFFSWRDK